MSSPWRSSELGKTKTEVSQRRANPCRTGEYPEARARGTHTEQKMKTLIARLGLGSCDGRCSGVAPARASSPKTELGTAGIKGRTEFRVTPTLR